MYYVYTYSIVIIIIIIVIISIDNIIVMIIIIIIVIINDIIIIIISVAFASLCSAPSLWNGHWVTAQKLTLTPRENAQDAGQFEIP